MQTFLPYPDFKKSASVLDNKRLGKQRLECLQILRTLWFGRRQKLCCSLKCYNRNSKGEIINYTIISNIYHWKKRKCPYCGSTNYIEYKTPWYNHPAVQMWKGYEVHLYDYLSQICYEWTIVRGYQDSILSKSLELLEWCCNSSDKDVLPFWLGNNKLHLSHQSNLIRKKPDYYRPIFGYDIPDDLRYFWPTKEK